MARASKGRKVFISHSRADASKLKAVIETLIATGLIKQQDHILREEDLPSKHRALRQEVKRQIQSASIVVIVWGENSANSQWVNYELGLADALSKEIIAVIPRGTKAALPPGLHDAQVVEISSKS